MAKIAFGVDDLDRLIRASSPNFTGETNLGDIINILVKYIFPAAGIVMLIFLIIGGYQVMLSGGNPKNIEQGRSKITSAIVGFIIIFAAYWIVQAIATILGLRTITWYVF